jgi:UPF0716 protein FxsA
MSVARPRRFPIGTFLFLLFTVFTLLELFLLVWLTKLTSLFFTIAVAIATGMIGSWMAKREGLAVFGRFQSELGAGRFPGESIADGLLILLGGALLITPGILTDLVGFSTLVAPCRAVYRRGLMAWARRHVKFAGPLGAGGTSFGFGGPPPVQPGPRPEPPFPPRPGRRGDDVVDVEFRPVD